MTFKDKTKERYFELKAKRTGMSVERVRTQLMDRLPSDQMVAIIEILTETLGLDDSKDLTDNINLED